MQAGVGRAGAGPSEMTVEPPGTLIACGAFISLPSEAGGVPRLHSRPWTLRSSRPAGQGQHHRGAGSRPTGVLVSGAQAPCDWRGATGLAPAPYNARPQPARPRVRLQILKRPVLAGHCIGGLACQPHPAGEAAGLGFSASQPGARSHCTQPGARSHCKREKRHGPDGSVTTRESWFCLFPSEK